MLFKREKNKYIIISPNNVFSEYISNVLPELGEDNPSETTYSSFLTSCIKEYKEIKTNQNDNVNYCGISPIEEDYY